jgi:hypothetical protein
MEQSSWMCKLNGETIDHLSLHCDIASEMCSLVFCSFGIRSVTQRMVIELLK